MILLLYDIVGDIGSNTFDSYNADAHFITFEINQITISRLLNTNDLATPAVVD